MTPPRGGARTRGDAFMNHAQEKSAETLIRVRGTTESEPRGFEVRVQDERGEMQYHVTMSETVFERLSGGNATPEACVHAAFLFLLDREPKEAILCRFDIAVIEHYFSEFFSEFHRYRDSVSSAIPREKG